MSKESKDLAAKAQWDSKRVLSLVVNNALMIIMIIAAIAIAIVNPNFVSASSIVNIISQTAAYLPPWVSPGASCSRAPTSPPDVRWV